MAAIQATIDEQFDALSYSYASPTKRSLGIEEQGLWCAVIEQAFVDAGFIELRYQREDSGNKSSREYEDAIRWLTRDTQDFAFVCSMAGVSPHLIRHAAHLANAKE